MHLNFTANRFVFGHIYPDIPPGTFFCKPCRLRTSEMRLNCTANSFVFGRTNRENAPKPFNQSGKAKTPKMRLNSTANRFVFGHINREMAPTTFYCKPCKQRTSRMPLNPMATNKFWIKTSRKCTQNFFHKPCKAEDFQNASEIHSKPFRFWTHNS